MTVGGPIGAAGLERQSSRAAPSAPRISSGRALSAAMGILVVEHVVHLELEAMRYSREALRPPLDLTGHHFGLFAGYARLALPGHANVEWFARAGRALAPAPNIVATAHSD